MSSKIVDLHIHSCYSDGTSSPVEIVNIAKNLGFSGISITDHDSVNAIDEALLAGKDVDIEVVPGVELSAYDKEEEIHVLGYYIDFNISWFIKRLEELRDVRKTRFDKMIQKLNELGVDIRNEQFPGEDKCVAYGRPHVAQLLLRHGYVSTFQEAFHRFIGQGGPAYVEKERLSVDQAVKIITGINGIPILAHPGTLSDEKNIDRYIQMGIKGIEVFHSEHKQSQEQRYLDYAQERELLITGGSDCHGGGKQEMLMGKVKAPYKCLENLKKAKRKLDSPDVA